MTPPADDAPDPDGPDEPRVTPPKPVRPRPAGRATTPKPVRAGLAGGADEPVGVVEEAEVELEVDGETLLVRVRGRSRGHTSQGAADLLLLGFHRAAEEDDEPVRESLVVGRELEALTPRQLEAAWRTGRAPEDPFRESELFPETSRGRGRGPGR